MPRRALLLLLLASPAFAQAWDQPVRGSWLRTGAARAGDVVLVGGGAVCEIVCPATEPSAVQQAAKFLAGDVERLSGVRPAMVAAPTGASAIRCATVGLSEVPADLGADGLRGQWEAYRVVTRPRTVWLLGSNFRGTAFAAYTLSERLGIDPLYLWTGYTPTRQATLTLAATDFASGPPTFRYRGLFHDDEDILPRPLKGDTTDVNGTVPLLWYQRFFETALRLRLNQVAPFVRVQRPFVVQQTASDWGLFYTSHHYDVVLSNPYGYDRFGLARARGAEGGYDWFQNQAGLLKFWRGGVAENRALDCIWPVGMRGTEDTSYKFPPGTTQAEKDRVFSEVIDSQVKMVKELLPPGKQPLFHFTLYGEMLANYQSGHLALPADVMLIWNDNGDGLMRSLPKQLGAWQHGVYYHLAFLGNSTKQTHHTVTPYRVDEQFRNIVQSGATAYMLTNVSELREFVMEARQIAEIGWDAKTAFGGEHSADRWLDWWSREYFAPAAPEVAAAYRQYYQALPEFDSLWYGASKVQGALASLLLKRAGQPFTPANAATLPTLQAHAAAYAAALQQVDQANAKLSAEQRQFLFEHLTLGLLIDYRPTQAAMLLVQAMAEPDRAKSWELCRAALAPLEQLEAELARAERPPFERWYGTTWIRRATALPNPHSSRTRLQAFLASDGQAAPK